MTIASQTSRITYTGDGSTTAFAVPFFFQADADLVVILQDTLGVQTTQTFGTNYTLAGATLSAGGTCTFVTAPTSGYLITIYRDPPATQTTSYNNNDPFPAKSHELALDKLTTLAQRVKDLVSRTIRQTEGEATMTTTLASIATRKNKLLGFDGNGGLIYPVGPTFVAATATGVADVDTQATASVTTFAGSINVINTYGLVTAGDGGGGTYIRGTVSSPGAFLDGGGTQYWGLVSETFSAVFIPAGRLTLTTGVSVTESDVSGATSVYHTPIDHDYTQIYNGADFKFRTFTERQLILDATGHLTNTLYDVWQYWDGSAVQIGTGPAWSNSAAGTSSRGSGAGTTEFEVYRGRPVNKNAIVLRNNSVDSSSIPARQANLLGTFRTTSAGMTEDSAAKRLLSNVYSAVGRPMKVIEATSGWPYSVATFRQANGSTANQLAVVHCLSGREVQAKVVAHVGNSSGVAGASTGIGINSSTIDSSITRQFIFAGAFGTYDPNIANYVGFPGLGYNEVRWLEKGDGTANTQTWIGNASGTLIQSGITGRVTN